MTFRTAPATFALLGLALHATDGATLAMLRRLAPGEK